MAQSKLRLSNEAKSPEELEFMQYGALKMVYMEQVCSECKDAMILCQTLLKTDKPIENIVSRKLLFVLS